ncbi:MAG: zinc-ribbon domain-containing protein [Candidatus Natronoplasma sp.]
MAEEDQEEGYIEEMIECPFCGAFVPNEFDCIMCGEEILETEVNGRTKFVCSNCQTEVDEEAEMCPECGASFTF